MSSFELPAAAEARAFLASTRLFGGLDAAALDEIATELEWRLVPGGTRVCRQGDEGDSLYLVASGRLVVIRELGDGRETVIGQKGRGDSLGELAVLTGSPRSATVRALRDSVLATLSRERAGSLLRKYPDALLSLTRMLAGWLHAEPTAPTRGCVALAVTAAGPDVPLAEFVDRLAVSLAGLGPTLRLDARQMDARFGDGAALCPDGSPEHARMTAWINEQEARFDVVVYEADLTPSAWTRRCLRQADHILVVAMAGSEPSLGALGPELARLEDEQGRQLEHLVLLHGHEDWRPQGTADWLALRPFRDHHHLRLPRSGDFDRLARHLTGNAIGLVLGGGGARGFAHIGVLRALEEAGIPVDRIGGTSMGAVIAAQYARGNGWQELLDLNRRGWVKMRPHKVYTLPLISICGTRKGEKMLDMMYGDDRIEDLWTSFFCVSTNITRTELVVHRQGSLRQAVNASMTIPGITPPILGAGGDLLVDGGVLDNLPTDVMRHLGAGPIIASDVSAAFDLRADPSYLRTPSPWQVLANRFRLRARLPPFPNILRLVQRSALLASDVYAKQAKRQVELYLDLPMEGFDMFDMDALPRLVEHGYGFTREKLTEDEGAAAVPLRPKR
jgi:NTE family protein/lysophospholipid hydrolase